MKHERIQEKIGDPHLLDAIQGWYQEYQNLDELSVKLDSLIGEINQLRGLVEQKMRDLDRWFMPPCD